MGNSSSKTFEVLGKINSNELDGLVSFVGFEKPGIRRTVFDFLRHYTTERSRGEQVEWSRPEIHNLLFPKEPFDDKRIRYLLSDIHAIALLYIGYLEVRVDTHLMDSKVSEALAKRNCTKAYSAHLTKLRRRSAENEELSPEAYFSQYRVGMTEAEWQLNHGLRSSGEMQDVLEHLDRFYLVKKLQLCCEALNVSNVLDTEQELFMLDELIWNIHDSGFATVPHIAIYLKIIDTIKKPEDETHFIQLTALLKQHAAQIDQDDLREMYHYVLNYSIKRINQGDKSHREVLLDNYRQMMTEQIILQDGQVSQWHYKNVITISIRQNELDFANTFLHSYRKHLAPEIQDNAYYYNLACLRFAQCRFREAISGLQTVDLDDLYYRLDARSILLKSYYELGDLDALFYHATSFRTFIKRNRSISAYQRTVYLNMIKFTLAIARAGANRSRLKRVQQRIDQSPQVADLQWVQAKVDEMMT